ncbi:MAG: glycosyltransferase family 2 protein [Crocinitomicaceae bacterium]|nr:glycosyltransferase family 2 protein [Crocinitomicaceae bacterium]MBK8924897.1 glycosyltransferase family 2 protein [Crocinitomicaceae bacterium]
MITATISTYNRERYLPGVLESLARQTLSSKLYEIVLINNNSPGNTQEIFSKFCEENPNLSCRYYLETNQGLSFGRNRGITEAKGKYITFIDDDAFLADDYLEKIYTYFEAHADVAAIGSKILLHYESIIPTWENKYLNSLLGYFNLGDETRIFPKSDYPRGSNMSFRLDVFQKAGMFNTELGRIGKGLGGGEEKDIFQRIYNFPELKVVYIPNAIVYHCVPVERTTAEFIRKQALGTGYSERLRVSREGGMSALKRYGIEIVKWAASLVLWSIYIIKGQAAKGNMIVRFRAWVSKGLFLKATN